ncbi:MAG: transcription termination factor Rho [Desulfobacterales bacterium]|jgi:hypothetical protein
MAKKEKQTKEKTLEKMTSKELREVALQIPEISGVHGLNKPELISAIKKARGIEEVLPKKGSSSVREIKKQIKALKSNCEAARQADESERVKILRRKISRLKKKTRRAA